MTTISLKEFFKNGKEVPLPTNTIPTATAPGTRPMVGDLPSNPITQQVAQGFNNASVPAPTKPTSMVSDFLKGIAPGTSAGVQTTVQGVKDLFDPSTSNSPGGVDIGKKVGAVGKMIAGPIETIGGAFNDVITKIPGVSQAENALNDHVIKPTGEAIGNAVYDHLPEPLKKFYDEHPEVDDVIRAAVDVTGTLAAAKATGAYQNSKAQLKTPAGTENATTPKGNTLDTVDDVINRHVQTRQTLLNDPDMAPIIKQQGGIKSMLNSMKEDVTKQLRYQGFSDAADRIANADTSSLKSLSDFKSMMSDLGNIPEDVSHISGNAGARSITPEPISTPTKLWSGEVPTTIPGMERVGAAFESGAGAFKSAATGASETLGNAFNKIRENISNVPENMKTIIGEAKDATTKSSLSQSIKDMFDVGRKAIKNSDAPSPLESAGRDVLGEAMTNLKQQLTTAGEKMNSVLETSGGTKIDPSKVLDVANTFATRLSDRLGSVLTKKGIESIEGRISGITSAADTKLVNTINDVITKVKKSPTLQMVNDGVDLIQSELFKASKMGAEPVNTRITGIAKEVTKALDGLAKDAGGDLYKAANSEYSSAKQLFGELNTRLGDGYKNAASMMKRVFSPQDGGTKQLFRQLEDATGVKIFEPATIAKFVMDTLDDIRGKSLLDTKLSKSGLTEKILEYLKDKIADPEAVVNDMLDK